MPTRRNPRPAGRLALAVAILTAAFAGLGAAAGPAFANLCTTNPDACGPKPTPPPTPSVVTNLTVSQVTQTKATLTWQDTSTNEDSVTIIRWKYVAGQRSPHRPWISPPHAVRHTGRMVFVLRQCLSPLPQ